HFIEAVVWDDTRSDYRQLLTSERLYYNDRLASFYGADKNQKKKEVESRKPFQPVSRKNDHRSGLLTHPYLLASFSYHNNTSPIHRGVFLTRNIVGRGLETASRRH
ncbi:MAG: DUF1588 domain-containing protein, partial [Verrucomicrobiota bacterium]